MLSGYLDRSLGAAVQRDDDRGVQFLVRGQDAALVRPTEQPEMARKSPMALILPRPHKPG
jgi:hypothetical protein